jgi:hypothetical protein
MNLALKYSFLTKYESLKKRFVGITENNVETNVVRDISSTGLSSEMIIEPFIFNWRGQFEKTVKSEEQLSLIFDKVTVINSDDGYQHQHWVNIGEDAYFAKQFTTALAGFGGDILFHVQGDAAFENWKGVVDNAKRYFEKYKWGVYAPNVDYVWLSGEKVNLKTLLFEESTLSMVTNPDCTCWFIHKDVINLFQSLNIDLEFNNKYGWGIDWIMCALSYQLGRPVIRDYEFSVSHPKHTGYNAKEAGVDLDRLVRSLDIDLQMVINDLYRNDEKLCVHFQDIVSKRKRKFFKFP